jgi:hypothetical protein
MNVFSRLRSLLTPTLHMKLLLYDSFILVNVFSFSPGVHAWTHLYTAPIRSIVARTRLTTVVSFVRHGAVSQLLCVFLFEIFDEMTYTP